MGQALKYIIDEHGKKTSVLVPVKVWEELNSRYKRMQKKLEVLDEIRKGVKEIDDARRTGRKLPSLKDVLG